MSGTIGHTRIAPRTFAGAALVLWSLLLPTGCATHYRYPGHGASIAAYENFIRNNPNDKRVSKAREQVLCKAASCAPWNEINRYLAQFDDIEGARYDEEKGRLVIWGPKSGEAKSIPMPPLLLDDFFVALDVLGAGDNPGVSIGTVSGRVPTEQEIQSTLREEKLPVEYIPSSAFGTHMGSVLFEIDRCLKGLVQGEDNLTRQQVRSSVPGYAPLPRRLQRDTTWEPNKPRPLGLSWFVPEEPGVAFEGYTIKFVRYRMRVEYRAFTDDPAVAAFSQHLNDHFDEYAAESPVFRELVRLHKLVQVARWYEEMGFPTDEFRNAYQRLRIDTPRTTKLLQTLASSHTVPGPYPGSYYIQQTFVIGGVDLSPRNHYVPAPAFPAADLAGPVVRSWQPGESSLVRGSHAPPRYGSFGNSPVPIPKFAAPILQACPSPTSCGWTACIQGRTCAVVSIPMTNLLPGRQRT